MKRPEIPVNRGTPREPKPAARNAIAQTALDELNQTR